MNRRTEAEEFANSPRILVIRLGAIGDALRVIPAIRRIKREIPHCKIGWLVEDWVAPLLHGHPAIEKIHAVSRRELEGGIQRSAREMRRVLRELRRDKYHVSLDFHGRFKSGLFAYLSGIKTRIGYVRGQSTECNFLFNNVKVSLDDPLESRVLRFLHLLAALGIDTAYDSGDLGIYVPAAVRAEAEGWYESVGKPLLAVYPGCSKGRAEFHRWPVDKWCELLKLLGKKGVRSVVFWGPDELELASELVTRSREYGVMLAPNSSLQQMLAMIGCFKGYIGSNTAATHMAWLQGVPTVIFTGPAEPRTDAPLAPVPFRVLSAREHFVSGKSKRSQPKVTTEVGVAEAFKAVSEILEHDNLKISDTFDEDSYKTRVATAS